MKKITRLEIKNFQSHKHTDIKFGDFTVIIGPTDSGKSAIIRAIKFCLYNEPSGTEFIRRGEKTAEVTTYFDDNTIVKRSKGGGKDFYELTDTEGKVIHLEAFGQGPVQEVVNFHGMLEVSFFGEKESLNICDQLSQPFFLTESPAARATMIGEMANTEVVDIAIKDVVSETREKKALARELKSEASDIKLQLKEFSDLPEMEKDLEDIKVSVNRIKDNAGKIDRLKALTEKLQSSSEKEERLLEMLKHEQEVNMAVLTMEKLEERIKVKRQIERTGIALNNHAVQANFLRKRLDAISIEEVDESRNKLDLLSSNITKALQMKNLSLKLSASANKVPVLERILAHEQDITSAFDELEVCQNKLFDLSNMKTKQETLRQSLTRKEKGDKVISDLQSQFASGLEEYKNALLKNPKCPFCASDIDKDKIRDIENII